MMFYVPDMDQAEANGHSIGPTRAWPAPHSLYDECVRMQEKVDAFLAEKPDIALLQTVQERLLASMAAMEQILQQYRFEQLAISWNGGKDCLVLLVIFLASIARFRRRAELCSPTNWSSSETTPFPAKLRALYIVSAHPFPEVDSFVSSSSADYHLDTARVMLPMREGLEQFLQQNPKIQAIFVGTRRTDPHAAGLTYSDPTDAGWPSVMRLHSVLDWRLAEIWAFIRRLEIPYCSLYDQGYTSLGGRLDTYPNPRLKKGGSDAEEGYRPAYELTEDGAERLGRSK